MLPRGCTGLQTSPHSHRVGVHPAAAGIRPGLGEGVAGGHWDTRATHICRMFGQTTVRGSTGSTTWGPPPPAPPVFGVGGGVQKKVLGGAMNACLPPPIRVRNEVWLGLVGVPGGRAILGHLARCLASLSMSVCEEGVGGSHEAPYLPWVSYIGYIGPCRGRGCMPSCSHGTSSSASIQHD